MGMKLLTPLDSIDILKSRDPVAFQCEICDKVFSRPKNYACRAIKGTKSPINYCSHTCSKGPKQDTFVEKQCAKCGTPFTSRRSDEVAHCSRRCANSRQMSQEQKDKLRAINLGKSGPPKTLIEYSNCQRCNKTIVRKRHGNKKYCVSCKTESLRESCRNRPQMGRNNNSKAAWYESPIAGRVWLESSWEKQCAEVFDKHNIQWERPKTRFKWTDKDEIEHHYYPDFYLIKYDVYLDPKNPWQQEKDKYKLEQVRKNHLINLYILNRKDINEESLLTFISKLEPTGEFAS